MQSLMYKNVMSLSCMFILTACSSHVVLQPPEYKIPIVQADDQYKYADLNWTPTSAIKISAKQWWDIYQDPVLDQLMWQLNQENLTLKQAEARYQQAQALLEIQRANRLPNITANGSANHSGAKNTSTSYVINKDNKAEVRILKLGLSTNSQIEILEGLDGTEKVVLEGIDRLSEGKEVQIISDDQPHPPVTKSATG